MTKTSRALKNTKIETMTKPGIRYHKQQHQKQNKKQHQHHKQSETEFDMYLCVQHIQISDLHTLNQHTKVQYYLFRVDWE